MSLSVSQLARAKRLSRGRVLQLIHSGELKAVKIGSQWVIDDSALDYESKSSRPFSPRMARAFIEMMANQPLSVELDPAEKRRLEIKLKSLKEKSDPSISLRSWLKHRAASYSFNASKSDLEKLRRSKDILLTGLSDESIGIGNHEGLQGYVVNKNIQELQKRYLLVNSTKPNVILRQLHGPLNMKLLPALNLSDLSDINGPREKNAVKQLVREL
ncbi:MAG: helix-turn-helix domain-containing protein [Candidatus Nanopelagicaceae bacterium]|jgi:excisionase family DNA binding protein|nr:helix-turn-helix domain-containing protein [Candidatus Nanopelagicaceae bacterium]